jgi:hypothetical protein
VLTAGAAVEVKQNTSAPVAPQTRISDHRTYPPVEAAPAVAQAVQPAAVEPIAEPVEEAPLPVEATPPAPAETQVEAEAAPVPVATEVAADQSNVSGETVTAGLPNSEAVNGATPSTGTVAAGAHGGTGTVVVTVGGTTPPPPATNPAPEAAPAPAAESPPPSAEPPTGVITGEAPVPLPEELPPAP